MARKRRTLEQYYKIDPNTQCWVSTKKLDKDGYGRVCFNYKSSRAHRYFYEYYRDKIPKGYEIDHLCKNRACMNPAHLEVVNKQENITRGNLAKLSKLEVEQIRKRYYNGENQYVLASFFGVGQDQISRIVNYKRWKVQLISPLIVNK